MKEKFPGADGVNEEDVEMMLDKMVKEIEKDLQDDPEALAKIKEKEDKKAKENFEIYGEAPEEEIDIDKAA